MIKSTNVFTPGTIPNSTYNQRAGENLESKLDFYLETGGQIVIISGPSKVGKTVLVHKVIDSERLVSIEGRDVESLDDLTEQIFKKMRTLPAERAVSDAEISESQTQTQFGGEIEVRAKFWRVFRSGAFINGRFKQTGNNTTQTNNSYVDDPFARVVDYMVQNNYVLVIDDFHYIAAELQKSVIQRLKQPLLLGLKVVFALIPSRVSEVVKKEIDMIGRTHTIKVPVWTDQELAYIPQTGFAELHVQLQSEIIDELVKNSFANPLLMQQLCAYLSFRLGVRESLENEVRVLYDDELMKSVYAEISENDDVVSYLENGRTSRGNGRAQYKVDMPGNLERNNILDTYQLVMLGLEHLATQDEISVTELYDKILEFNPKRMGGKGGSVSPRMADISKTLVVISDLAKEKNANDPVVAYKEETKSVFMYDSFFSFNLKFRNIRS